MPIGFGRSILSKTAVATGAATTQGGYWNSIYDSDHANGAEHPVVDIGASGDWHSSHDGTFQIMWWVKGQTSNFDADNKQMVLRTNSDNSGDNGIFVEFASDHVQAGTQTGSGGNSFHFFKWTPADFATNYLDNNWHHFLFEVDGTSSQLYVDGVDKTSEAADNNIGGAAQGDIGGTTRYAFIAGSTTARNDGSYNGFRTGNFQFADVWFKNKTTGDLASNISTIYSSGWQDPTADGTFGSVLPAPDIFLFADGSSLGSSLVSGASVTTVKSGTGGFNVQDASGPGGN